MQLTFENGQISLGDSLIPGILTQMKIKNSVIFDNFSIDSISGTKKIPMGFSDSDISVSMDLLTDDDMTCYDRLAEVNRIFKAVDEDANLIIYTILNFHCAARGIQKVYFSGLNSQETDQDNIIAVTLSFIEYIPDVVKKEEFVLKGTENTKIESKEKPDFKLSVKLEK